MSLRSTEYVLLKLVLDIKIFKWLFKNFINILKAISYARARDDYQTAIGQVTGEELEEMGLTRFQFEDFINNIKEAMESDQFKEHLVLSLFLERNSNKTHKVKS